MINMDQIDVVMAKTGAGYDVVRAALLEANGDTELAVEKILAQQEAKKTKDSGSYQAGQEIGNAAQHVISIVQEVWEKGNASNLVIEKDGKRVLQLSLTVGTIGLILAPLAVFIGLGAALLTDYDIRIEMNDGTEVNVNEMALMRVKQPKKDDEA